ncbi:MAG: hypothetical protein ACRD5F_11310 [Candidatus Acidiferrales bacterium]
MTQRRRVQGKGKKEKGKSKKEKGKANKLEIRRGPAKILKVSSTGAIRLA